MENEVMNYEETVMEPEVDMVETEDVKSGVSTGTAMLIGAGVAFAATAVVKLVKKAWAKHKANKELRRVDDDEPIEVTDEQVMEVVK